jgi:hypothetical protein
MWGMDDPVTGQPALLVTEQNITQVGCSKLGCLAPDSIQSVDK